MFYTGENPNSLKYCVVCKKYKPNDDFSRRMRFCKKCQEKELDINTQKINKIVANYFDITLDEMLSKKRKNPLTKARQISMYFATIYTTLPDRAIGFNVGGMDRNTVKHSVATVKNDSKKTAYKRDLKKIEKLIIKGVF